MAQRYLYRYWYVVAYKTRKLTKKHNIFRRIIYLWQPKQFQGSYEWIVGECMLN